MQYFINSKDGSLQAVQNCGDKKPFFTFMSTAEFHKCKEQLPYYKELLHCLGSIRYCKAEVFKNCIIGTLRLPQKSEQRSPQLSFSFYLTGQSLLFVEDVGNLKLFVEKRISMFQELNSPAQLLLQFMEQMIEDDILYLSHIESETEKMEENIGSGGSTNFFPLLTKHRQKLSELNAYYEQLTDIGELFQSRACSPFANDTQYWDKFTHSHNRHHLFSASYFNYGMVWNELCLYAGAEVAIRLSVGDYCFSYYRNRRNHLLQKEEILLIFPT